jgi:cytidine deaminase
MNDEEIIKLLRREITKSKAPVSGKKVGTVMRLANGDLISAHNTETELHIENEYYWIVPAEFQCAEANALANLDGEDITDVFIAGDIQEGSQLSKLKGYETEFAVKQVIPCETCYGKLAEHYTPSLGMSFTIMNISKTSQTFQFTFRDLEDTYRKREQSETSILEEKSRESWNRGLRKKTMLSSIDREFVSKIVGKFGNTFDFYLTGSALGYGGRGTLANRITSNEYSDIDLIAINPRNPSQGRATLAILNQTGNTALGFDFSDNLNGRSKVKIESPYENGKNVDLTIGECLETSMRPTYFKNNFYLQLSRRFY